MKRVVTASKKIPLTKGGFALVNDSSFKQLSKFKWNRHSMGYAYASILGEKVFMHRLVLNAKKGEYVDHINQDILDNRKSNLRLCSKSQNNQNQKLRLHNSSGIKGVRWNKVKLRWIAIIKVGKKQKYLGKFVNPFDAARAYDKAAIKYFGEFARTNAMLGLFKNKIVRGTRR